MSATRAALLALALGAVGCTLSAEGELPEVEVTQHDLTIPGVPREARTGDAVVALPSFFQPNDHLGLSPDQYRSVKVKSVVLSLKRGGGGDLSFVRRFDLTINGLQGFLAGVAPAQVAHYDRPAAGAAGASITARSGGAVEVVDAWRDSLTVMTVDAAGDLPEDPWTVDVTVRVSAVVKY